MSKCNLHVWQKVVCVKNWNSDQVKRAAEIGIKLPVKGVVYTVRSVEIVYAGQTHIKLHEIVNAPVQYGDVGLREQAFCHTSFEPVVERKTDISCFKAMLNPTRSAVPA